MGRGKVGEICGEWGCMDGWMRRGTTGGQNGGGGRGRESARAGASDEGV